MKKRRERDRRGRVRRGREREEGEREKREKEKRTGVREGNVVFSICPLLLENSLR